MKRLVAGLLVAAAVAEACGGSDEGGSVTTTPVEAGPVDVPEGGVDSQSAPDTALSDQSTGDAPTDAPVRGNATITVISQATGLPSPDAKVVLVEPDGTKTVLSVDPTTGKVTVPVLPGSSVTSVQGTGGATYLETIEGVEPGDNILIGSRTTTRPPISVNVMFEPLPITIPVTYMINVGCFSTAATENMLQAVDNIYCAEQNGTAHLYVEARNGAGRLLAIAGKDVGAGQTATFVLADWKDAVTHTFDIATVPGLDRYDGRIYWRQGTTWNFGTAVGATPLTFGRPAAGQVDLECQNAVASKYDMATNEVSRVGQLDCSPPQNGDVLSLGSPPPITESMTVATSMDRRPMITWTTSAPMAGAFGAIATALAFVSNDGGPQSVYRWEIVTPAKVSYAQPPALPAALAALLPAELSWSIPSITIYAPGAGLSPVPAFTAKAFRQAPDELARVWENGATRTNPSAPAGHLHVRYTGRYEAL